VLLNLIALCCSRCGARDHNYERCPHLSDGSLFDAPAPSQETSEREKQQVSERFIR
jgi:hypothetical protein